MSKQAKLTGKLTIDTTAFERGLKKSIASAKSFSRQVAAYVAGQILARGIMALGRGVEQLVSQMEDGVKAAYNMGAMLYDTGVRTGIAAGQVLILNQIFKDAGVDAGRLGLVVNKMQKFIDGSSDSSSAAAAMLGKLGFSYSQLEAMSPDKQFMAIGAAIGSIQDPAERAADAIAIFGKGGGEMQQVFDQLANGGAVSAMISIGRQAKILSENSDFFKAISVLIGHMENKSGQFFTGMASSMSDRVFLILSKIDSMDFTSLGEKIGSGLSKFADAAFGAFKNPAEFRDMMIDAFEYAAAMMGNILIKSLLNANKLWSTDMMTTIQRIGDFLLGTITNAFQVPIAYMQAEIAHFLESLPGTEASKERSKAQGQIDKLSAENQEIVKRRFGNETRHGTYGPTGELILAGKGHSGGDLTLGESLTLQRNNAQMAKLEAAAKGMSVEQWKDYFLGQPGGVKVATTRGQFTANQLIQGALTGSTPANATGDNDPMGSAGYKAAMEKHAAALESQGDIPKNMPLQGYYNNAPINLNSALAKQLEAQMGMKAFLEMSYKGQEGGNALAEKMAYGYTHHTPSPLGLQQLIGTFGRNAVFGNKALGINGMLYANGMLANSSTATSPGTGKTGRRMDWYDQQWAMGAGHHVQGTQGGLGIGAGQAYGFHWTNKAAEARYLKKHGQGEELAANIGDLGRKIDRPAWTQEGEE